MKNTNNFNEMRIDLQKTLKQYDDILNDPVDEALEKNTKTFELVEDCDFADCDSVCEKCINYHYIKGSVRGIMDADPDETYCEEESENFMTEDGCYKFEEAVNEMKIRKLREARDNVEEFVIENGVLKEFNNIYNRTEIKIPSGVTSIGDDAFWNRTGLTAITIPDSVKSIGDRAFIHCTRLTHITIPSGVTSIGRRAFEGCFELTSITIPDSVKSIGDHAFEYCVGLTSVTIGNGVTSIGDNTFCTCKKLAAISIPDSVTSIGDFAFDYCVDLSDVYYSGSEEDWDNLDIRSHNIYLLEADMHFNSALSESYKRTKRLACRKYR